jgi:hypothetical protein
MKHEPVRRHSLQGLLVALIAVLAGAWAAAGCSDGSPAGLPEAGPPHDLGLSHVHGLGINPADGELYAATHTGLFRLAIGRQPERVGEHMDLMGFTVGGPDHLLASGHPSPADVREGRWPPHLGLIRSLDGGRTWESVALLGAADFHGLAFVHGLVFGWDSTTGRLLVSADQETWEERSRLALFDLTVSPADPHVLLAATADGLLRSADGGKSWSSWESPSLVLLSWPRADQLWGIGPRGDVFSSKDAGVTWEAAGTVAATPEAFLASGDLIIVAVHGRILESRDGGQTWVVRWARV